MTNTQRDREDRTSGGGEKGCNVLLVVNGVKQSDKVVSRNKGSMQTLVLERKENL